MNPATGVRLQSLGSIYVTVGSPENTVGILQFHLAGNPYTEKLNPLVRCSYLQYIFWPILIFLTKAIRCPPPSHRKAPMKLPKANPPNQNAAYLPVGIAEFRNFMLEVCIPQIKLLTRVSRGNEKNIPPDSRDDKLQQTVDKAFHSGVNVIAMMYRSYPKYLFEVDEDLSELIRRALSANEIDFFLRCHELFKKTELHARIQSEETQEDYGGQCFRAAYVFMSRHRETPKLLLVHGWVYNPSIEKYMAHAWVEENAILIHDLSQDKGARIVSKIAFYELALTNEKHIRLYTIEQMDCNARQTGHYGPWDDLLFTKKFLSIKEFHSCP